MAQFREYKLSSGMKILLGKNAENNDELVKKFKGTEKVILHTVKPGSPFCVVGSEEGDIPTEKEIHEAGIICASRSQAWRDKKSDVELHQFTGKDVKKTIFMKAGSWKLKGNPKVIKVKKKEIEAWEKK